MESNIILLKLKKVKFSGTNKSFYRIVTIYCNVWVHLTTAHYGSSV